MNPLYYNTNGFAFHRLEDATKIVAGLGYDGVALTPDVHHLDPFRATAADVAAYRRLLDELHLRVVVETGARFLLDPRRKHRPSLLDAPADAAKRVDLLRRAIDLGHALGAPVVSTWSGAMPEGLAANAGLDRLSSALGSLCAHAKGAGIRIGFEPEPGMAVETVAQWERVRDAVANPVLGLTLDVGHCLATGEGEPEDAIRRHAREIVCLQLDDHRRGRHDHLLFGEGEVRWPEVARAIREAGYEGPLEVELSRHSSEAPSAAARSQRFLHGLFL